MSVIVHANPLQVPTNPLRHLNDMDFDQYHDLYDQFTDCRLNLIYSVPYLFVQYDRQLPWPVRLVDDGELEDQVESPQPQEEYLYVYLFHVNQYVWIHQSRLRRLTGDLHHVRAWADRNHGAYKLALAEAKEFDQYRTDASSDDSDYEFDQNVSSEESDDDSDDQVGRNCKRSHDEMTSSSDDDKDQEDDSSPPRHIDQQTISPLDKSSLKFNPKKRKLSVVMPNTMIIDAQTSTWRFVSKPNGPSHTWWLRNCLETQHFDSIPFVDKPGYDDYYLYNCKSSNIESLPMNHVANPFIPTKELSHLTSTDQLRGNFVIHTIKQGGLKSDILMQLCAEADEREQTDGVWTAMLEKAIIDFENSNPDSCK